jgi:hypothetical protein
MSKFRIGMVLFAGGVTLMVYGLVHIDRPAPAHWIEAQLMHSQEHQWELFCDGTGRILAVIQPDDGGGMVLWGADRVAYGTYIDVESAQRAAEGMSFKCR